MWDLRKETYKVFLLQQGSIKILYQNRLDTKLLGYPKQGDTEKRVEIIKRK